MRGRNNLSVSQVETEPIKALETVRQGIEVARRLGQRSMFNWLVGTYGMYSVAIGGDWDLALELLEETLSSSPNEYDQARATLVRGLINARRGIDLDGLVAKAAAAAGNIKDGQITGGGGYLRGEVGLIQGHYAEAVRAPLRAVIDWPDSDPFVLQPALHALVMTRNLVDAKEVKAKIDKYESGTPAAVAARRWAAAIVDWLEDRPAEALRSMRWTIDTMRSIGMSVDAAGVVIDAVRMFPDDPEVRALVPSARSAFEDVGAVAYLRLLDDAVATEGASVAVSSAARELSPRAVPGQRG